MQQQWSVKQFRVYVLIALFIMLIYILLAYWLEQQTIAQHEADFNTQQALQTQLSARSIEDHFSWVLTEVNILAKYSVPLYLAGSIPEIAIQGQFFVLAKETYPEEPVFGIFTTPGTADVLFADTTEIGQTAKQLLATWIVEYWDTVKADQEPLVTPFNATPNGQLYGLLLPIEYEDEFAGILGTVLDFGPVLERYVIPMRSGQYGAAWVLDNEGAVIYDHETQIIGSNISQLHVDYPDVQRIDHRLLTEAEGTGEYRFTGERGGEVKRKLVAWSAAHIGNQRIVLALSAPDSEINATLAVYRRQSRLLGILLGVAVFASGGLFYLTRQHALEQLVEERTHELQKLNDELEKRVIKRTAQLDQERAQLQAILDATGDGLVYYENKQVKFVNRALAAMLGYTSEELIGQASTVREKIASSPEEYERVVTSVREGFTQPTSHRVQRNEAQLQRKDGSIFDAGITSAQVCNQAGDWIGTVDVIRDISQQKALQSQKDRFISHASHELRTPLSNLKTRLYLLRHQPDKRNDHIQVIEKVTNDMITLVEALLDVSRFELGKIELSRLDIILQDVLRDVLQVQTPEAEQWQIRLIDDLAEEPIHVHADYRRLAQAITNLVVNAVDYSADGSEIRIRLFTAPGENNDSQAVIQVQDDGPGIAPELLSQVFEPFFQASEGRTQSTGLGLPIAREIIERHGGQITVENTPGHGCTFTVSLPTIPPADRTS
ncbi:MAG: PAS domain S-box protein [Anaerolineae bacterium]|nr:PAS domain S-box protein [Anaerolineae bacterium]